MLEDIRQRIEKLIALYENERRERLLLEARFEQSEAEREACRKQITDLERQLDNLRLAAAFRTPSGDDSGAREKIERLVREMDKCISLLER